MGKLNHHYGTWLKGQNQSGITTKRSLLQSMKSCLYWHTSNSIEMPAIIAYVFFHYTCNTVWPIVLKFRIESLNSHSHQFMYWPCRLTFSGFIHYIAQVSHDKSTTKAPPTRCSSWPVSKRNSQNCVLSQHTSRISQLAGPWQGEERMREGKGYWVQCTVYIYI